MKKFLLIISLTTMTTGLQYLCKDPAIGQSLAVHNPFRRHQSVSFSRLEPALKLAQASTTKSFVSFPEVGLSLPQPDGFEKAATFHGFQQPSTNASIILVALPSPFSEISNGFNRETLATRGLTLISKEAIAVNDTEGLLLKISQPAFGQEFLKWIIVFGNENRTHFITATFPKEASEQLSEGLKANILAVQTTTTEISERLPFSIEPAPSLIQVKDLSAVGKLLAFTKDGTIPAKSPNDPLFIVTPSLNQTPILDRQSFALKRLQAMHQTSIEDIQSINEVSINNLDGIEIIATGTDLKSETPLTLYQVILFPEDGGYILMVGNVGRAQGESYLSDFKAMARTYETATP